MTHLEKLMVLMVVVQNTKILFFFDSVETRLLENKLLLFAISSFCVVYGNEG
jgi:hypothetical protein